MKVPGYCTECHRSRQVTVTSGNLGRGLLEGVCAECENPKCEHGNCQREARWYVLRSRQRDLYPVGQALCDWHEDHASELGVRCDRLGRR